MDRAFRRGLSVAPIPPVGTEPGRASSELEPPNLTRTLGALQLSDEMRLESGIRPLS